MLIACGPAAYEEACGKVSVARLTEDSSDSCMINLDIMNSQDCKQQLGFIVRCP